MYQFFPDTWYSFKSSLILVTFARSLSVWANVQLVWFSGYCSFVVETSGYWYVLTNPLVIGILFFRVDTRYLYSIPQCLGKRSNVLLSLILVTFTQSLSVWVNVQLVWSCGYCPFVIKSSKCSEKHALSSLCFGSSLLVVSCACKIQCRPGTRG